MAVYKFTYLLTYLLGVGHVPGVGLRDDCRYKCINYILHVK